MLAPASRRSSPRPRRPGICIPAASRCQGFALLVTIVLVAFLVLILVGLATFTRVETQVASNSQSLAQARQNALFALNIAVGELQRTVGPDTSTTARADILDAPPAAPLSAAQKLDYAYPRVVAGVRQPYWTGAWPAGAAGPTWLVSRNPDPAAPATERNPTPATDPINGVVLARSLGLRPDSTGRFVPQNIDVTVPRVPLTATDVPGFGPGATQIGEYAFWVSDEGAKAKLNQNAEDWNGTDFADRQRMRVAPPASAAHRVLANMTVGSGSDEIATLSGVADDLRGGALPAKILDFNSARFAYPVTTDGQTAFPKLSPDFTVRSAGVLSNSRTGGLRRDLTAAFEDGLEFQQFLAVERGITGDAAGDEKLTNAYTAAGASAVNVGGFTGGGLRWLSFFSHYNLYKDAIPNPAGSGSAAPFAGMDAAGNAIDSATPTIDARALRIGSITPGGSVYSDYLGPRLLGFAHALGISVVDAPAPAGRYTLRMHVIPQVLLHNPYNVRLRLAGLQFRWDTFDSITPFWRIRIDGADYFTTTDNRAPLTFQSSGSGQARGVAINFPAASPVILEPGEARVFGLTNSRQSGAAFGAPSFYTTSLDRGAPVQDANVWRDFPDTVGGGASCVVTDLTKPIVIEVMSSTGAATYTNLNSSNHRLNVESIPAANQWPTPVSPAANDVFRYGYANARSEVNISPSSITRTYGDLYNASGNAPTLVVWQVLLQQKGVASTPTGELYPLFAGLGPEHHVNTRRGDSAVYDLSFRVGTTGAVASDMSFSFNSDNRARWGLGAAGGSSSGKLQNVLFDIPRQPMLSLGQFRHMQAYLSFRANGGSSADSRALNPSGEFDSFSLYPVGGSYASTQLPLNATVDRAKQTFDDVYVANDRLFDDFFLSTVPSAYRETATRPARFHPIGTSFNQAYIDAGGRLGNERMVYYRKDNAAPALSQLRQNDTAASRLLLDGAFNVNSTSATAWSAILGSSSPRHLSTFESTGSGWNRDDTSNNARAVFARTGSAYGADGASANDAWHGVRTLDDDQVRELSEEIVIELKRRFAHRANVPFRTLGSFVNRSLTNTAAFGVKGLLQAAIDNSGVNSALSGVGTTSRTTDPALGSLGLTTGPFGTGAAALLSDVGTGAGIPGWLMQHDLVETLATLWSARSDTFTVRTYGASVNPATGAVDSRAYLEAVVQRVPDYVDQTDPALVANQTPNNRVLGDATPVTAVNSTNRDFGRRFRVVSFRWLSPDEL